MSISFNPMTTTGISDGFVVSTGGYVQGTFLDDPANRYNLEGGYVGSGQTPPLWGGLAVALAIPAVGAEALGPALIAATSLTSINGWTLFNQSSAGILTPTSNVPLYAVGQSINFARPGSNLRICVAVENTAILNDLAAEAPNVDIYWDPTNLCITTTSSSNYGPLPVQIEFLSESGSVAIVRI